MVRYIVENKDFLKLISRTRLRKHMAQYSDKEQGKRPHFGIYEIEDNRISAVAYYNPDIGMEEPSEILHLSKEVAIPLGLWNSILVQYEDVL